MKKNLCLFMVPILLACGNTAQRSSNYTGASSDSIAEWVESTDSFVDYNGSMESVSDYSTQTEPTVEKTFMVVADAFRYNSATGHFSSRGEYTLQVTLYSDHSVYAVGREGVSMRVQKSLEDKWDYMCAVPGENNYAYFFNTDEIYSR